METPTWAAALLAVTYFFLLVFTGRVPDVDEGVIYRSGVSLDGIAKALAWLFGFVAATFAIVWVRRFSRAWPPRLRDATTATLVTIPCMSAYLITLGLPDNSVAIAVVTTVVLWLCVAAYMRGSG